MLPSTYGAPDFQVAIPCKHCNVGKPATALSMRNHIRDTLLSIGTCRAIVVGMKKMSQARAQMIQNAQALLEHRAEQARQRVKRQAEEDAARKERARIAIEEAAAQARMAEERAAIEAERRKLEAEKRVAEKAEQERLAAIEAAAEAKRRAEEAAAAEEEERLEQEREAAELAALAPDADKLHTWADILEHAGATILVLGTAEGQCRWRTSVSRLHKVIEDLRSFPGRLPATPERERDFGSDPALDYDGEYGQ